MAKVVHDDLADGQRVLVDWFQEGDFKTGGFILGQDDDSKYIVIADTGEISAVHGVNLRKQDLDGEGFLAAARQGVKAAVHEYLEVEEEGVVKRANFADPVTGQTALHEACASGKMDIVRILLDHGADWACQNAVQMTAVEYAASKGQTNAVSFALEERCKEKESKAGLFLKMFRKVIPEVTLANVVFIRSKDFLEAGEFKPFRDFADENLHVSADTIPMQAQVLLISHRWVKPDNPDPDTIHFITAKEYISRQDPPVEFIWIDFSCVDSEDKVCRERQIKSLPLVMFLSSQCLVLPALGTMGTKGDGNPSAASSHLIGCAISDLNGYLTRSWCVAESLCCSLIGCPMDIAFSVEGSMLEFVRNPGPGLYEDKEHLRGGLASTLNGSQRAALLAATHFPLDSLLSKDANIVFPDRPTLWKKALKDWWWPEESHNKDDSFDSPMDSAEYLTYLMSSVQDLKKDEMLLVKAATYSLTTEDMESLKVGKLNLKEFVERMGFLSEEGDRLLIFQLMIIVLLFCLDIIPPYFEDNSKDIDQEIILDMEEVKEKAERSTVDIDSKASRSESTAEQQVPESTESPPIVQSKPCCCCCGRKGSGKCSIM